MFRTPSAHSLLLAIALSASAILPAQAETTPSPARTPVLVELFTSEGCSSCPPADTLLAHLLKDQPVAGADIIVLEEHVDSWESLGWHDRFSSHQFTDRQSQYVDRLRLESGYTPQMVVDGTAQFVGNDSARALRAIAEAARTAKPSLTISRLNVDGSRISTSVANASASTLPKAELYAALIESTASTSVLRGENGGRTLHHVSVVRAMQKIGAADSLTAPLFFSFAVPKDAPPWNLRVIVFAQRSGQGMVVAAASSTPPPPVN